MKRSWVVQDRVLIAGGGIGGLAAALALQDRGLKPLVLESESRVGGRMTTDRKDGFVIDRGVTLLGNRFAHIRRLVRRFGMDGMVRPVKFSFGLQDRQGCRGYRVHHPEDVLCDRRLSCSSKLAMARFYIDLFKNYRALTHGRSDLSEEIDDANSLDYLGSLGAGGDELFTQLIEPGLKGPVGGSLNRTSRAILMQTFWNVLATGSWNLTDGVDRIPEALATKVPVLKNMRVCAVQFDSTGVEVRANHSGSTRIFRSKAAILAIPGNLAAELCPQLPDWISNPLSRTSYAKMASVHVALRRPPNVSYAGYSFTHDLFDGVELELEHLRAPGRCPDGTGLISAYFFNTPRFATLDGDDSKLEARAVKVIEHAFPECKNQTLFVHMIRWDAGIAQFPPGRLTEMIKLRQKLSEWDGPVDVCGDYLDGISSEGALRTGEQAAERVATRLMRGRA